ncbi:LV321 protein, partial [Polypterus senegalus]|nr:LV321 protein [Polypterus senegalus]
MRRRQLDLLRCVTLALLATPSWSATLFQPSSVVLKDGKPARIECRVGGSSTRDTTFYWYRQKGDTELLWILYYQDTSTQEKAESFAGRFSSTKQRDRQAAFLIITETSRADEATYFCAVWSAHRHTGARAGDTKTCQVRRQLAIPQSNRSQCACAPGDSQLRVVSVSRSLVAPDVHSEISTCINRREAR